MPKRKSHARAIPDSMAQAMAEWCRACLSFPTVLDMSWQIGHPYQRDPKLKK